MKTTDSNIFAKVYGKRMVASLFAAIFLFLSAQAQSQENLAEKKINISITKNTTLPQLEAIKQRMKAKGFGFQYSNVVYNDNDEIISISIKYTDASQNSGNYTVGSDKPINTIQIASDGNRVSVKSVGSGGNQTFMSQGGPAYNSTEQHGRNQAISERSQEIRLEMEERMREMEERHEKRRAEMLRRRDSMRANSPVVAAPVYNNGGHKIRSTTTSEELKGIQEAFKSKGILFNYGNPKRNSEGEITNISITIDNQKGSVSTSAFGNATLPIDDILIVADANQTIMKTIRE